MIQREQLEPEHVDAAFWLNLFWSITLMLLAVALAEPWSRLMDIPELRNVIIVLAPTLLLRGLTMIQQAQLQRALNFKVLALRTNASMFTSGVVGIALAMAAPASGRSSPSSWCTTSCRSSFSGARVTGGRGSAIPARTAGN